LTAVLVKNNRSVYHSPKAATLGGVLGVGHKRDRGDAENCDLSCSATAMMSPEWAGNVAGFLLVPEPVFWAR